jgi:predicted nucleic acid-binding Zn finger protein
MQQLKTIEHKNEDVKRECKGRRLAISRNVFHIENETDSYYCQSENKMDVYYCIRYAPETLIWCSCPDSSIRQMKCKHIWSIEYAIRLATVKDVDKLPIEVKREVTKSYTEDGYSF